MTPFFQRALAALCLLSLVSCSSKTCRQWDFQSVITGCKKYNSGRLILPPDCDQSHLELEIIRDCTGYRMYLNILFLQAPPRGGFPDRADALIAIEGDVPHYYCLSVMEGGQRLLFNPDDADKLMNALLENKSLCIEIGRLKADIIPKGFSEGFQKLSNKKLV